MTQQKMLSIKDIEEKYGINRRIINNLNFQKKGPPRIIMNKKTHLYPQDEFESWLESRRIAS